MSEEELRKNDILFQIDMQLYDEFNDKFCEMNEHLGDIYSLRDIEELEQAEKEKERKLLREAIRKLQKENKELTERNLVLEGNKIGYKLAIDKLQKQLDQLKEVDKQICNEELITKDKYQEILKENEELKNKLNSFYGKSATKFISKNIIRKRIDELLGE